MEAGLTGSYRAMFAVIAVILFAVALILHLTGAPALVLTLTLGGLIALALHLVPWGAVPWKRPA